MEWRVAAILFAVALATRLPFATEHLWAHDSVLYARAIESFDPAAHRPQPPGYLYYVALVRAVASIVGDPNRAMTLLSAFAGAAAVALVYAFAARTHGERVGRGAALLLLTSVTFWGYGAVAYPYTLLAALSVGCAWLFWRALERGRGGGGALAVASAAWGVAIGFRTDLGVFLLPLWGAAALAAGLSAALVSGALFGALAAAWLAASAAAAGGLAPFLDATRAQAGYVAERHSVARNGLPALAANAYELARAAIGALYGALLLPLVALLRWPPPGERRATAFVAMWAAAPLPMYLFVHIGDLGYFFSSLPGLCVLAAYGALGVASRLRRPRLAPLALGTAALANAVAFLFADVPVSAADLARRDRGIAEKMRFLDTLARDHDVVVVAGHDRALVHHYAGERHAVVGYAPNGGSRSLGEVRCATRCDRTAVVVWDDSTRVVGSGWRVAKMKHGARLRVARLDGARELRLVNGSAVELARSAPRR